MIIIHCAGMKRSGSTLQFNLVKDIVSRTGNGVGLSTFEARKGTVYKEHKYNVVKGHPFKKYDCLPFVSIRHPLDCIVSVMDYQSCSFWKAFEQIAQSIEQVDEWLDNYNYYLMKYEELFSGSHSVRIFAQVYSIASYLGIEIDVKMAVQIANDNSYWKVKPITDQQPINDPHTWLSSKHLGDGKVRKYKNRLDNKQIDYASKNLREFMERHNYSK